MGTENTKPTQGEKTGVELIAIERQRQIDVEGWTPEHDSEHKEGQIALAAVCYALPSKNEYISDKMGDVHVIDALWPWGKEWFKPTDPIRDLVKAGALIVAEIDRLVLEEKNKKRYKVVSYIFFGGSTIVRENLTYSEAKKIHSGGGADVYESLYIEEMEVNNG